MDQDDLRELLAEIGIGGVEGGNILIDPTTGRVQKEDWLGFRQDTGIVIDSQTGRVHKEDAFGFREDTGIIVDRETGRVQKEDWLGFREHTDVVVDPETGRVQKEDWLGFREDTGVVIDPKTGRVQQEDWLGFREDVKLNRREVTEAQPHSASRDTEASSSGFGGSSGSSLRSESLIDEAAWWGHLGIRTVVFGFGRGLMFFGALAIAAGLLGGTGAEKAAQGWWLLPVGFGFWLVELYVLPRVPTFWFALPILLIVGSFALAIIIPLLVRFTARTAQTPPQTAPQRTSPPQPGQVAQPPRPPTGSGQTPARTEPILDWATPVNLVAEEAIFLLDGPAGFPGRLTVLSDGIQLKTLMKTGRWQFWKIQAIEIVNSESRPRIAITFRPDLSGEGAIGIEPQDRDTQALWSRMSAAYHRWLESDLGREQLATRDGKPPAGGASPVPTPVKALVFLFHFNFDDEGVPSLLSDREPYQIVDASYRALDDPSPTASAPRVYWSHGAPVAVGTPLKAHYAETVNGNGQVIDSFPIDFAWRRSLGPAYFRVPYSTDVQSINFYHSDGGLLFAINTSSGTERRERSVAPPSQTAPPFEESRSAGGDAHPPRGRPTTLPIRSELDLNRYCTARGFQAAVNRDGTGYGWSCTPGNVSIDVNQLCREQFGAAYRAFLTSPPPGMAGDWRCRADLSSSRRGQPFLLYPYV